MAVRPGKGDMIDLVNGLCLIQDKIQAERAFDFMKDPKLSNVGGGIKGSDVLCVEQTLWSYPHSITSWNKCLLAGEL